MRNSETSALASGVQVNLATVRAEIQDAIKSAKPGALWRKVSQATLEAVLDQLPAAAPGEGDGDDVLARNREIVKEIARQVLTGKNPPSAGDQSCRAGDGEAGGEVGA